MPSIPTLSPSLAGVKIINEKRGNENSGGDDEKLIEETMSEIRQDWPSILQEQFNPIMLAIEMLQGTDAVQHGYSSFIRLADSLDRSMEIIVENYYTGFNDAVNIFGGIFSNTKGSEQLVNEVNSNVHMLEESLQHKRSDLPEIWERVKKCRKETEEKDLFNKVVQIRQQALFLSGKHHHLEASRLIIESSSLLPDERELEKIKNQFFDLIFQDIIQVLFIDDLLPQPSYQENNEQQQGSNDELVLSPLEFDFNPLVDPISFLKESSKALSSLSLLPKFISTILPRLHSLIMTVYESPIMSSITIYNTISISKSANSSLFQKFITSKDDFERFSSSLPIMMDKICQRILRISSAFAYFISFLKDRSPSPSQFCSLTINESQEMLNSLEGNHPFKADDCIRTDGVDLLSFEKSFILSSSGIMKSFLEALVPKTQPISASNRSGTCDDKFSFLKTLSTTKVGISSIPLVKKNFKKTYFSIIPTKESFYESDFLKNSSSSSSAIDPSLIMRDPYCFNDVSNVSSASNGDLFKGLPGIPSYAYLLLLSDIIDKFSKELHTIFSFDYELPFEEFINNSLHESILPLLQKSFSISLKKSFLPLTPSTPLPPLSNDILELSNTFINWWNDLTFFCEIMFLSDADNKTLMISLLKEFLSLSENLYTSLTLRKGGLQPSLSNILSCKERVDDIDYMTLIEMNQGDRSLVGDELITNLKNIKGLLILKKSIQFVKEGIPSFYEKEFSTISWRILETITFELLLHCIFFLDLEHREGSFCANTNSVGHGWIDKMSSDLVGIDSLLKIFLPFKEYNLVTKDLIVVLSDLLFKNFKYIKAMDSVGALKLSHNLSLIREMLNKMDLSIMGNLDLIEKYYNIAIGAPNTILGDIKSSLFSKDQLRDIVLVYQNGIEMMGGGQGEDVEEEVVGKGKGDSFDFSSILISLSNNTDPGNTITKENEDI